ncbi:hypothetical protein BJ170DRAFT_617444 [Xylariales sp. AK1849]|nr:hypothetical protein BJ170DRAFT_617444 [Xylariales sp. AK1849]
MHFITIPMLLAAGSFAAVTTRDLAGGNDGSAEDLVARDSGFQVNYYTDGGCADFLVFINPFTDGSCYEFDYNGENSANIANCDAPGGATCICTFFNQDGCEGAGQSVSSNGENCASNFGRGFLSMSCAVAGV